MQHLRLFYSFQHVSAQFFRCLQRFSQRQPLACSIFLWRFIPCKPDFSEFTAKAGGCIFAATGAFVQALQSAREHGEPRPTLPLQCLQPRHCAEQPAKSKAIETRPIQEMEGKQHKHAAHHDHVIPRSSAITAAISGGGVKELGSQTGATVP